jgi:RNA polymerase sigma factor (sigma-70 family)
MDEWELLQQFARHGAQEAFAELVRRHLNFVYSSARRQVGSPQLAQEVAQAVFLELARQAAELKRGAPLTAWLYIVTRRMALNALRAEQRRRARDHAAYELSAMNSVPSVWTQLEPVLDEALATLGPDDRCALLLRYFENKPLRDVGAAMAVSEDAAQKRIGRALDQLRKFFARQGVAVTAAGLATELSAHAVSVAPPALAGAIATATVSLGPAGVTASAEATGNLVMTTLQKTMVAGAMVMIGAGLYEVHAWNATMARRRGLEVEAAALASQETAARRERDTAVARVIEAKVAAARGASAVATGAVIADPTIAEWVNRATRLQHRLESNPAQRIPELALLKETDWLQVARERPVDSEDDLRASLGRVRALAKGKLGSQLTKAFSAYVADHQGALPNQARDLQPHIAEPIEPTALATMLDRYRIGPAGAISDVPNQAMLIEEKANALVDPDFDFQFRVTRSLGRPDPNPLKVNYVVNSVPGPKAPKPTLFTR